jgi:hypothetical protein
MKIHGLPTYAMLNAMHHALHCNTNLFSSTLGGGEHCYLNALMSVQNYLADTAPNNVAFVALNFLGYNPVVNIRAAAMAAQAWCSLELHQCD